MSADERNVTTDALTTLGTIIDANQKRDAIHLAVEPVVAGERLKPGDHITVADGVARKAPYGRGLGIVDPFVTREIAKGERFWFVMYPRQVRSLRHVWTHPAFPNETPTLYSDSEVADAKKRIAEIASDLGPGNSNSTAYENEYNGGPGAEWPEMTYDRLMEAAAEWLSTEEYLTQFGSEHWRGVFPQYADEFWCLYQIVTGKGVPDGKRMSFFSCSC